MRSTYTMIFLIVDVLIFAIFAKTFLFYKGSGGGKRKKIFISLCLMAFSLSWSDLFLELSFHVHSALSLLGIDVLRSIGIWIVTLSIVFIDRKSRSHENVSIRILVLLSFFPCISIFWDLRYSFYLDPDWTESQFGTFGLNIGVMSWILLLTMNFLLCIVYFVIARVEEERTESRLVSHQLEAERRHYADIEQMQRSVRGVRHDLNNTLSTVLMMLDKGEYAGARAIITGAADRLEVSENLFFTGNPSIDSIISLKIAKAHTSGIEIDTDVNIPVHLSLNCEAMPVIFGNLLDNAIEALQEIPEKERCIKLFLRYTDNMLILTVSNRCMTRMTDPSGSFSTTKEDKELHGFGISNIRQSVERLGGTLRLQQNNGWFHANIILYDIQPE